MSKVRDTSANPFELAVGKQEGEARLGWGLSILDQSMLFLAKQDKEIRFCQVTVIEQMNEKQTLEVKPFGLTLFHVFIQPFMLLYYIVTQDYKKNLSNE